MRLKRTIAAALIAGAALSGSAGASPRHHGGQGRYTSFERASGLAKVYVLYVPDRCLRHPLRKLIPLNYQANTVFYGCGRVNQSGKG